MQISCRCKKCGHQFLSDSDQEVALEFDFLEEEVRFVCREKGCKHINIINFAPRRKTQPLPGIIASR